MNESEERHQLGTRFAAEVTQLLEHATKQWELVRFEMSSFLDLTDALPDVAISDAD